MGVMACSRSGCENIMCHMYSSRFGYICWECFNELVKLGPEANIGMFMDSPGAQYDISADLEAIAIKRLEAEFGVGDDEA